MIPEQSAASDPMLTAAGTDFDRRLLARLALVSRRHSYADISRMTGFHRETCRRYLMSGHPTLEFIIALCEALGVSAHWLLLGVGPAQSGDASGRWLAEIRPLELLVELGRRWSGHQAELAQIRSRVDRLEAELASALRAQPTARVG